MYKPHRLFTNGRSTTVIFTATGSMFDGAVATEYVTSSSIGAAYLFLSSSSRLATFELVCDR